MFTEVGEGEAWLLFDNKTEKLQKFPSFMSPIKMQTELWEIMHDQSRDQYMVAMWSLYDQPR